MLTSFRPLQDKIVCMYCTTRTNIHQLRAAKTKKVNCFVKDTQLRHHIPKEGIIDLSEREWNSAAKYLQCQPPHHDVFILLPYSISRRKTMPKRIKFNKKDWCSTYISKILQSRASTLNFNIADRFRVALDIHVQRRSVHIANTGKTKENSIFYSLAHVFRVAKFVKQAPDNPHAWAVHLSPSLQWKRPYEKITHVLLWPNVHL